MRFIFIATIFLAITSSACLAVDNPSNDIIMQHLVDEVHQLRLVMQQSLSLQASLEQIKHQRDVVTNIQQQLEFSKDEAENQSRQRADFEETIKDLESKLTIDPNNKDNSMLKNELLLVKKSADNAKYQELKMKDKEYAYQSTLNIEESRLSDLKKTLDAQLLYLRQ